MVFAKLRAGFLKLWAARRLILIFYLANLFWGILLVLPFRGALRSFVGDSTMGQALGGRFDMDFWFEFIKGNPGLGKTVSLVFFFVLSAHALTNLFLSGGALAIFARWSHYSTTVFWSNAASYFGRFFRLFWLSLPVFVVLYLIQFAVSGLEKLIFGEDPYQYVTYWGNWIRVAVGFLAIVLSYLIFDYARIYTVVTNERRMRQSLWQGIRFTFGNFPRTFILIFSFWLLGTLGLLVYNPVVDLFRANHFLMVLLILVWQQLFMLLRMLLKLALYAAEVSLFKSFNPELDPLLADENPSAASPPTA